MYTLRHLCRHPGVQLNANAFLGLFQDPDRQVARTGTDLQHGIGGFEEGLVDNGVGYTWVLENVLADVGVEFENVVRSTGTLGLGGPVVGRCASAAALGGLYFGHDVCVCTE